MQQFNFPWNTMTAQTYGYECMRSVRLSRANQSKIQIGRFNYECFQVLIYHYATNIAVIHKTIS